MNQCFHAGAEDYGSFNGVSLSPRAVYHISLDLDTPITFFSVQLV